MARKPVTQRVSWTGTNWVLEKIFVPSAKFKKDAMRLLTKTGRPSKRRSTFVSIKPRPDVLMIIGCLPKDYKLGKCVRTTVHKQIKQISDVQARKLTKGKAVKRAANPQLMIISNPIGDKRRSKGKGRGLGRGRGKGPIGIPIGTKNPCPSYPKGTYQVKNPRPRRTGTRSVIGGSWVKVIKAPKKHLVGKILEKNRDGTYTAWGYGMPPIGESGVLEPGVVVTTKLNAKDRKTVQSIKTRIQRGVKWSEAQYTAMTGKLL